MELKKNPNVELVKSSDKFLFGILGFVFTVGLMIVLFSFTTFEKVKAKKKQQSKGNSVETVIQTVQSRPVAPPPPTATTVIDLVDDNQQETPLDQLPDFDNIKIPEFTPPPGGGGQEDIEDITYDASSVEEQPMYGETEEALYEFLGSKLEYPEAAKTNGVQGTVWVTFTIDKSGKVTNVTTDGKEDPDLEAEAKRIITETSGGWTPAKFKKKPVKMICKIPIEFELND